MDKLPPRTIHSATTSVPEKSDEQQVGSYHQKVVKELSSKPEDQPPSDTNNKSLAETKASKVMDKVSEDDEEVKSKPEAAKMSPAELTPDSEMLKQAFLEMPWQDNPKNQKFIESVALKINEAITAFTSTTTEPEKAYGYFQKAVICHRCGKTKEARLSLEIAISLNPQTVKEQLELAKALLFFSKPSDDYAEAFAQFVVIGNHYKNSLMAHLKIAEMAAGLYPDFKLPVSPTNLPKILVEIHEDCFLKKCFPEALYTNDLELAYLVPYPLFAFEGRSAGDRLIGDQLLWAIMDAVGKYKKIGLPGCHKGIGMGSDLYDSYSRVVTTLGLAKEDEPLRKTILGETLLELKRRLLMLKRVKYSNPITYTEAIGALLLGLAHRKQLVEDPSNKVAADCYLTASNHPAFKELLADAARQYEKVMCYREAASCQKALAEHLNVFPGEAEKFLENAEDNLKRAEDYDLFLQEVEQLSLEPGEATAKTKTKEKKKRKKQLKPSLVSEQDSPNEPPEEKVLPASPMATETKAKKKSKEASATHAFAPTSIGGFEEWDFTAKQFLREIYYARKREDFALQKAVFHQAKKEVNPVPESCEIYIESAWHHLHQIDLELKDRVTLNKKGQPAELEELCRQARMDLAKAFQRLTGLKISHAITPETMKQLLQQYYPCPSPVPEEQKRFRYRLRKIMSSFGHSYSFMADKHPSDKQLGHYVREFYNLKKVANPEYSKTTPVRQEGKVRLINRSDFEIMQRVIKS